MRYTVESRPPWSTTCGSIYTACQIAQRYRNRIPSIKELRSEFGMSQATAYRWRSAISIAMRPEIARLTP